MANRVIYTRLPYDSEVEYLQSSNTQWIDTLYKMTLSDEIRTKVYHLGDDSKCAIFGSRGAATNNFYQFYIDETLASQVAFGQSTPRTIQARIPSYQVNGMNEIIFKDGLCICNGSSTQIPVGTENSLQNLAIFARRNQDSSVSYHMIMKLYYFQIYHNGTLVRDFIPARKGLTGYLYDKVSKKLFANKGTDKFILGPDIANTSPNIRRVFRFGNKRFVMPMPYDSKIEYLESTGTQWIDTGIYGDINTAMECVVYITDTSKQYVIAGDRSSTTANNISFLIGKASNIVNYGFLLDFGNHSTNRLVVGYSYTNGYVKLYTSKNIRKLVDITSGNEYINQTIVTSNQNTPATIKIAKWSNNYPSTLQNLKGRIKSFRLWSSDTLLLDLIPVRRGNVGYLYDKVSGKLFGNAGTGNFVLGQDVAKPIVKRYVVPSGLEEGVDYEFVNALLLTNYNLVRIEPNYPVIFKVKPIEGIQNVVVNSGQNVFFIQNYTSSYKRWQAWNYDTPVTYDISINGINTFTLNANKFIINSSEHSYPSYWNFQVQLVFNTRRSNGTGSIVFYSIKSESMDLRPIRLLRNISGKHTFDRQPKTIGSLGLLDTSNQILYFGSGENISVYND